MVAKTRQTARFNPPWLGFLVALVALGAGIAILEWSSPFAAFRPGPARQIEGLYEIPPGRRDDPSVGGFFLTSVYVDSDVNWVEAAIVELTDRGSLVPVDVIRPPNVTDERLDQINLQMLEESEMAAKVVALQAAGFDVALHGEGVTVAAVAEDGAAQGVLNPGDLIVGFEGQPIQTVAELVPRIRSQPPGTSVTLTVRRDGATEAGATADPEPVTLVTKPAPDAPTESLIGIAASTHNLRFDLPFPIEFSVGNLGGGSAGLMFALSIYDGVTPGDLTHGHKIAGTGTITPDGAIGPIGGVREKVRSAESIGASYFIAPIDDAEEAKAAATKLTVLPVATFEEAKTALQNLGRQS